MWTRGQLKSNARINMKRNYWSCVAVAFIMSILEGAGAIGERGTALRAPYRKMDTVLKAIIVWKSLFRPWRLL